MTLTALLVPVAWTRGVLGFAAAAAFLLSILVHTMPRHMTALGVIVSLTAALAAVMLLTRRWNVGIALADRIAQSVQPFVSGFVGAALVSLMIFAGRPFMILAAGILGDLRSEFLVQVFGPAQILSIVLAIAGAALFFWQRHAYRTPAAFGLAAVAILFAWRAPMLGPALFVLACAMLAQTRAVAVFAAGAVLWVVSAAYYSLQWTLTEKAWSMAALGLALALLLLLTLRRDAMTSSDAQPARPAFGGLFTDRCQCCRDGGDRHAGSHKRRKRPCVTDAKSSSLCGPSIRDRSSRAITWRSPSTPRNCPRLPPRGTGKFAPPHRLTHNRSQPWIESMRLAMP